MITVYHSETRISWRKLTLNFVREIISWLSYSILRFSSSTFSFRSETYRYLFHYYNATWKNERAVEIPIVIKFLEQMQGKKILEVGNVLHHYHSSKHDVLDKYEKGFGVLNLDIVSFRPKEKYDFIVSISTLEHVGWDEEPKDPSKIDLAIHNLTEHCLSPRGIMVVTLPIGYNSYVDELLSSSASVLGELFFLKRVANSKWEEVRYEQVRGSKYNFPFPASNAICVSIFNKV